MNEGVVVTGSVQVAAKEVATKRPRKIEVARVRKYLLPTTGGLASREVVFPGTREQGERFLKECMGDVLLIFASISLAACKARLNPTTGFAWAYLR
jgi:hypothetical protein